MALRLNPSRLKLKSNKDALLPPPSSVFIAAILHLIGNNLPTGVQFVFRTDGKLFNLNRFKAKSKLSHSSIMELQYADDNVIVAHTEEDLQATLNAFSRAYKLLGLTLNIKKTHEVFQYP